MSAIEERTLKWTRPSTSAVVRTVLAVVGGGLVGGGGVAAGEVGPQGTVAVGSDWSVGSVVGGGVEVASVPQATASHKITSDRNPTPYLRAVLAAECSNGVPERQM